jgi:hypothetical protein
VEIFKFSSLWRITYFKLTKSYLQIVFILWIFILWSFESWITFGAGSDQVWKLFHGPWNTLSHLILLLIELNDFFNVLKLVNSLPFYLLESSNNSSIKGNSLHYYVQKFIKFLWYHGEDYLKWTRIDCKKLTQWTRIGCKKIPLILKSINK